MPSKWNETLYKHETAITFQSIDFMSLTSIRICIKKSEIVIELDIVVMTFEKIENCIVIIFKWGWLLFKWLFIYSLHEGR